MNYVVDVVEDIELLVVLFFILLDTFFVVFGSNMCYSLLLECCPFFWCLYVVTCWFDSVYNVILLLLN